MRLHNFFIEEAIGEKEEITLNNKGLYHQLRDVFRMNVGGQVVLLDNSGYEYVSQVTSFSRGSLSFGVLSKRKNTNIPSQEIFLFQSVIKKDKFEWMLEKGTEIGVTHFIPLLSLRSEKKNINIERGEKIIKEAGEQSGRGILPKLSPPQSLPDVLQHIDMPCLVFHGEGEKFNPSAFKEIKRLAVFIGPEGGWDPKDLDLFKHTGASIVSLGTRTLRAETASIAASALLLL